jgi:hypothetical protein
MLTRAEIEAATLRALHAYSGEQWRAIARVEKELAACVQGHIVTECLWRLSTLFTVHQEKIPCP